MNELSYSFLLPVYQVDKHLAECLDSIINQSHLNFEIILIIDGSRDNSILIAKEYAQKDHRISIYEQENQGIMKTRIRLVEYAKKDICVFVDPDDTIEPNLIESIHSLFIDEKCDLVLYRFNRMSHMGRIYQKDWNLFPDNQIFMNEDKMLIWEQFVSGNRLNHVWSKAFKRELFDPKVFINYSDVYGEDVLISMHLIHNSSKIGYRNLTLYNYRNSDNGLGRQFKLKYIDDSQMVRKEVYHFLNQKGLFHTSIPYLFYTSYVKTTIRMIKRSLGHNSLNHDLLKKLKSLKMNSISLQANEYLKSMNLHPWDRLTYTLFQKNQFNQLRFIYKIEYKFRKHLKQWFRK